MHADVLAARDLAVCKKVLRGQQHSRRAEAALQRVALLECVLQVGDDAGVRQPLDGLDARAGALHRQREAAARDDAIDQHRTGTAHAVLAADVAASQAELLAQEIDQGGAWLDRFTHSRAVHGEADVMEFAHGCTSRNWAATRRSRTPARWRFTAALAWMSPVGSRSVVKAATASSIAPASSVLSALRARTGVAPTPK